MSVYLIPIGIISVLILLNGLFVAAEFAIVAVLPTRMAQRAEAGSGAARHVLSILRNPLKQNRYITAAQVGITIVSLGLGMYGEEVVTEWFVVFLEPLERLSEATVHTLAFVLAVGLLTYLHVVIGEMIPKSLALQSPEPTVLALDRPMTWAERIFRPLVVGLTGLANWLVHLVGVPPVDMSERLYSPQELEFLVDESFEEGLIESEEQLFIENIFDLSERTVGQVMTPRTRVVGIKSTARQEAVLRRLCETGQTRYPVYEGDLDHIVGTLHVKDLARQHVRGESGDGQEDGAGDLKSLCRPAVFLPESLTLEKALIQFRTERLQMAIVVDEYGGTAGLITLEDLIEEVVGEIQDEFDQEIKPMEVLSERVIRARGDLILDELNQHFDLALQIPEVDTVGGLVMTSLGRIPRPGDVVEYESLIFKVEAVRGLAVQTVLVTLPGE